jgi:N-acylneuraminate cytidylyltransferase
MAKIKSDKTVSGSLKSSPSVYAFVPVRGGSESIPLKNIKIINHKPLLYWALLSLEKSKSVKEIIVATDSAAIKKTALSFGFKKVKVFDRSRKNATAEASTESVMLEYLEAARLKETDLFMLVQATNPFTTTENIDDALALFAKNPKAKSLLTAVRAKRFFWTEKGQAINYNPAKRPRRQEFAGLLMENGAFYISRVADILKSKNRLTKPCVIYEMPEHSGFEIDEVDDWLICEALLKKHRPQPVTGYKNIKLLLTDVDGVLTDAGMYYTENGDEIKKFNTYDGMALKLLQKSGVKVGILTAEDRQLNRNRARKLGLDYEFHGVKDKLRKLKTLLKELNLEFSQVAYVGDDLNDLEVLKKVGFAFCPASAQQEVLALDNVHVLKARGGSGVIRELHYLIR